jgi:hypothetical protein
LDVEENVAAPCLSGGLNEHALLVGEVAGDEFGWISGLQVPNQEKDTQFTDYFWRVVV